MPSQGHRLVADAGEEVVGKGDPAVALGWVRCRAASSSRTAAARLAALSSSSPVSHDPPDHGIVECDLCLTEPCDRLLPPDMASGKSPGGFTVRSMNARPWVWLLLVFALLATACGGENDESADDGGETEAVDDAPAEDSETELTNRSPRLKRTPALPKPRTVPTPTTTPEAASSPSSKRLRSRRSSLHPTRRLLCRPRCSGRPAGNRRRHRGRLDLDRAHPVEAGGRDQHRLRHPGRDVNEMFRARRVHQRGVRRHSRPPGRARIDRGSLVRSDHRDRAQRGL